jgi:hypothetical protein
MLVYTLGINRRGITRTTRLYRRHAASIDTGRVLMWYNRVVRWSIILQVPIPRLQAEVTARHHSRHVPRTRPALSPGRVSINDRRHTHTRTSARIHSGYQFLLYSRITPASLHIHARPRKRARSSNRRHSRLLQPSTVHIHNTHVTLPLSNPGRHLQTERIMHI